MSKFPSVNPAQQATEEKAGIIRIANQTETSAGSAANLAVSPKNLDAAVDALIEPASTTVAGKIEIATDAEAIAASATDKAIVPSNLAALTATNLAALSASDAQAIAASSSAVYLTPSNLAALTATNLAALSASDAQAVAESSSAVYLLPSNIAAMKKYSNETCRQSPILESNANTGAAPSGSTGDINIMNLQGDFMEQFILGAGQTIIAPRMAAAGLLVSLDLTDDEGAEYNWGARNNAKNTFTIGTDPAFYLEWNFTIADVTGADPIGIGFRKVEANNAALASYTDFAFIGVSESDNSGTISIKTRLNSGGVTTTDTTDAWADGETHRLKILVDAAGAVTYEIDGGAPTATAAFTFDDTDVVMPFFHLLHGTTSPGAVHWVDYSCGPQ